MGNSETDQIDDYRWLVSDPGAQWMAAVAGALADGQSELTVIQGLRKRGVTPARSGLLVKQTRLRALGHRKFDHADSMLFEEQLLQQATDERLARTKAQRFREAPQVVDLCCGLGGDLMGLACEVPSIGVDQNELAVFLAAHNCRVCELPRPVDVVQADVCQFSIPADAWFHIDPDRRRDDRRSTRLENFSPGIGFLEQLLDQQNHGAIKLAPASKIPDSWSARAERQWLGDRHECKQQLVWFGDVARYSGRRSACAVDTNGELLFDWTESAEPPEPVEVVDSPGRYLLDPHATIVAGRLTDSIAAQFDLRRIARDVNYLTSDHPVEHGALSRFEILEIVALQPSAVKSALQTHDCGQLEIKKRGVDHLLMEPFQRMKFAGTRPLTLVC